MKKEIIMSFLLTAALFLPYDGNAHDTLKLYLNAGYITSFVQPEGNTKPDDRGSFRLATF